MAANDGTGAKKGLEKQIPASENASFAASQAASLEPRLDASLTEDAALSLLKRADIDPEILDQLSKIGELLKHRKVKLALVEHPKTPRHVSLPLIRQLYTFDLMQVALTPVVPADVKRSADETLCNRLDTICSGERLTLAHRGSGRIAEALLSDAESRVMQAALHNARLTESSIVRALARPESTTAFVDAVAHHPSWSLRREVRITLLRNAKTPPALALEFARALPLTLVREILHSSRLPATVKEYLLAEIVKPG
jgi:hypothetical protein